MQKEVEDIIKDISLRNGIPFEVAKNVVYSQFKCIRETLKEGEYDKPETFKTVNVKYLGKFYTTEGRIRNISKKIKNGNNQDD